LGVNDLNSRKIPTPMKSGGVFLSSQSISVGYENSFILSQSGKIYGSVFIF
jgi:hypothetical protein